VRRGGAERFADGHEAVILHDAAGTARERHPDGGGQLRRPRHVPGTVTVSRSPTASVLIGGKVWLQMPKAVAIGACVCTAARHSGRAPYAAQCMRYSVEGARFPSTTAPSGRMRTRSAG